MASGSTILKRGFIEVLLQPSRLSVMSPYGFRLILEQEFERAQDFQS